MKTIMSQHLFHGFHFFEANEQEHNEGHRHTDFSSWLAYSYLSGTLGLSNMLEECETLSFKTRCYCFPVIHGTMKLFVTTLHHNACLCCSAAVLSQQEPAWTHYIVQGLLKYREEQIHAHVHEPANYEPVNVEWNNYSQQNMFVHQVIVYSFSLHEVC